MAEKLDILRKVRILIAKAENEASSDNEVYICMAKARELMAKYKIEESDLELAEDEITIIVFSNYLRVFDTINNYINKEYLSTLARTISINNYCKSLYQVKQKQIEDIYYGYDEIKFIGKQRDLEVVIELFKFSYTKFLKLSGVRYREAKKKFDTVGGISLKVVNSYQPIDKTVFIRSYLKGTLQGLEDKYEDMSNGTSNSEFAVTIYNYKHSIDSFISKMYNQVETGEERKHRVENEEAFHIGKQDALEERNNLLHE